MEELNTGATSTVTTGSASGCSCFLVQPMSRATVRVKKMSREALEVCKFIVKNFLSRFEASRLRRDNGFENHRKRCAPERACSVHRRPQEPSIPQLDIAD